MKSLKAILYVILLMLLLCFAYFCIAGCNRTVKNVVTTHDTIIEVHFLHDTTNVQHTARDTVYVGHRDTIRTYKVYHDSILVRDSVYVKEKGDSVYIYKEKWNTRVDIRHDTVYKAKADTVYKCITDTQYIYRAVSSADSLKQSTDKQHEIVKQKRFWWSWGKWVTIALLIALSCGIVWFIRKKGL